jgi:cyclopropane-fatty-acyl-phospholipid synthase
MLTSMEAGSKGRLICDSILNIGPHYARTLREWRRRFQSNFSSAIAPALYREYPDTMGGARAEAELETFRRKWLCKSPCLIELMVCLSLHQITCERVRLHLKDKI